MSKRVVVTGASSGIGWETALLMAGQHFDVVLVARREERLRELAALCRDRGATAAHVIAADLSKPYNCETVVEAAIADAITPLVLVNCAGIALFGSVEEQGIEEQLELNLLAPMVMCRAILPRMLSAGGGQIINVLSIAATHPFPGAAVYGATKAGLLMFGRSLAAAHRAEGLRLTAVIPGSTDTALWEGKSWMPEVSDMLPAQAVAEVIRDVVISPPDRNIDEITVMPPKGIL